MKLMNELTEFLNEKMVAFDYYPDGEIYIYGRKGVDISVQPSVDVEDGYSVSLVRDWRDPSKKFKYVGEMRIMQLRGYIERIVTKGAGIQ